MGGFGAVKIGFKHPELFCGIVTQSGVLDLNIDMAKGIPLMLEESRTGSDPPYNFIIDEENRPHTFDILTLAGAFSPNSDNPPTFVDLPVDEFGNIIEEVVEKWLSHNPANLISQYEHKEKLPIFIDCGIYDDIIEQSEAFCDSLKNHGIEYQYNTYQGDHFQQLGSRMPILFEFCDSVMNSTTDVEVFHENVTLSIYPNPFSQLSIFNFQFSKAEHVSLGLYDMLGNEAAVLVDGWREAGRDEVRFDGSGLAPGVYFYVLQAGERVESGKVVKY